MSIILDEHGKRLDKEGITVEEARKMAVEKGKVLVLKDSKRDVYRIEDAGKLKYDKSKRERKQRAMRRTHKIKEIKISPLIGDHDLEVKMRHVRDFLQKGLKTKITMMFKGRQQAFKDAGRQKLNEIVEQFKEEGLATADGQLKSEGRNIIVFLNPNK